MDRNDAAIAKAVFTLNEVMRILARGVNKSVFEQKYRGRYVSPGVTVQQYVRELRLSGSLEENDDRMQLKRRPMVATPC